jgi:hypothetical protein
MTAAMLGELDWSSPAAHDAAAVDVHLLLVFLCLQVRGFTVHALSAAYSARRPEGSGVRRQYRRGNEQPVAEERRARGGGGGVGMGELCFAQSYTRPSARMAGDVWPSGPTESNGGHAPPSSPGGGGVGAGGDSGGLRCETTLLGHLLPPRHITHTHKVLLKSSESWPLNACRQPHAPTRFHSGKVLPRAIFEESLASIPLAYVPHGPTPNPLCPSRRMRC